MKPGQFKLFRFVGASVSAFLALGIVAHPNPNTANPTASAAAKAGRRRRRSSSSSIAHNGDGDGDGRGFSDNHDYDGSTCEIYVVAKDGIYLDAPLLNPRPLLCPGSRIDVAVRCAGVNSYDIVSHPDAPYQSDFEPNTVVYDGVLATFNVAGAPATPPMKLPAKLPPRPSYMPDFVAAGGAVSPDQQFSVVFYTPGGQYLDMLVSRTRCILIFTFSCHCCASCCMLAPTLSTTFAVPWLRVARKMQGGFSRIFGTQELKLY